MNFAKCLLGLVGKFATICVRMCHKVGNRLYLKAVVLLHIFKDLKPAMHDVLMPFIFFKMGSSARTMFGFWTRFSTRFCGLGRILVSGTDSTAFLGLCNGHGRDRDFGKF
jgi:hypothetical protein